MEDKKIGFWEKLKSRKFQVFITWLVIAIVSLFRPDLPKETIFQFFGFVSLTYIGSNLLQDFIATKNHQKENE